MSWSKLSDDFSDDCWTLSDQAFRLHAEGLVWSNRKLLDCRIPKDDVRRFAKHPDAVRELLDVGFWSDEGDSYVIRHHARYQRLREAVVNQQAANERNGKKGGRPKREQVADLSQETQSVSESTSGSETERDRTGQAKALVEERFLDSSTSTGEPVAATPPPDPVLSPPTGWGKPLTPASGILPVSSSNVSVCPVHKQPLEWWIDEEFCASCKAQQRSA